MDLFFSTNGRINRQPFWVGAVILIVIGLVLGVALGFVFVVISPALASVANLILGILFIYPSYCLTVKRLHDRNSEGKILYAYYGLLIVSLILSSIAGPTDFTNPEAAAAAAGSPLFLANSVIGFILLGIGIYLLVVCGFLKGTEGPNDYGPDPLESQN